MSSISERRYDQRKLTRRDVLTVGALVGGSFVVESCTGRINRIIPNLSSPSDKLRSSAKDQLKFGEKSLSPDRSQESRQLQVSDFRELFSRLSSHKIERVTREEEEFIPILLGEIEKYLLSPQAITVHYSGALRVGSERGIIIESAGGNSSLAVTAHIQGGGFATSGSFQFQRMDFAQAYLLDRRRREQVEVVFLDRADLPYHSDRETDVSDDSIALWESGMAFGSLVLGSEGEATFMDLEQIGEILQTGSVNTGLTRRSAEWLDAYWNTPWEQPQDQGTDSASL